MLVGTHRENLKFTVFKRVLVLCEGGTVSHITHIQGGSNMTGTDLYVNKPHCAAAVRP